MTTEHKEAACEIGRWDDVAEEALKRAGFTAIDRRGTNDWEGWGVLLGCNATEFAVLSWSYGSCAFCDNYEDLSDAERAAAFDDLIERGLTEQAARALFNDRKGW